MNRSNAFWLVLCLLASMCACASPRVDTRCPEKAEPLRGLPEALKPLKVCAWALDGDGTGRKLDNDEIQQVVDSNGVIDVRFDNRELQKQLVEAQQNVEKLLQNVEGRKKALKDLKAPEGAAGVDAAHAKANIERAIGILKLGNRVDVDTLRKAAEALQSAGDYTVEVTARRTTTGNAQSQLVIPNWTEGKGNQVEPNDLRSVIKRLAEAAKQAAKEAGEADTEEQKVAGDKDTQPDVRAAIETGQSDEAQAQEAALKNITRSAIAYLPDVHIPLDRAGVERDDLLDIALIFRRKSAAPASAPAAKSEGEKGDDHAQAKDEPQPTGQDELAGMVEYHLLVDDLGWSVHVRPQLIFFRSTSGTADERKFQMNAAGLVEWAYRYPDSSNGWKALINGVEPAFGSTLQASTRAIRPSRSGWAPTCRSSRG